MDDKDRPDLSLGQLTNIADEWYGSDDAAWEVLRPLLKPKGWNERTRFKGPRPPKLTAKFYLILTNYSYELFNLEAMKFPRYPPSPHFPNWLINLSRRVEDHAMSVVKDIESSDPEMNFSYHEVVESEMRKTIQGGLRHLMTEHYQVELPPSTRSPRTVQRQIPTTASIEGQTQPSAARTKGTICAPGAVAKLEAYLAKTQESLTEFAGRAGTSDKTLRGFRKTGKVRRYIFDGIAKAMGLTRDQLIND
jgi:hypothetical protein